MSASLRPSVRDIELALQELRGPGSEDFLRLHVVIPLLPLCHQNLRGIESAHGYDEWGVDVLFLESDLLGDRLYGVQLKTTPIQKGRGRYGTDSIEGQARQARDRPFHFRQTGYKAALSGYWVMTSSTITGQAWQRLNECCDWLPGWLRPSDGAKLASWLAQAPGAEPILSDLYSHVGRESPWVQAAPPGSLATELRDLARRIGRLPGGAPLAELDSEHEDDPQFAQAVITAWRDGAIQGVAATALTEVIVRHSAEEAL